MFKFNMFDEDAPRVYFYGFDKLHRMQGNPWKLRGSETNISTIKRTAQSMLRTLDTVEVIVIDASIESGRAYKELIRKASWKDAFEHVNFYEFVKSQDHLRFVLK